MKTFVFDADGVVCVGDRFDIALEKRHQIPRARLAAFFAGPFAECILGQRDLKEALLPHLAEWGWRGSVEELLEFWFRSEHVMCTEVLACVRALRKKGHGCVLGTNQEKHRAAYMRAEMQLAREFDHVYVSCELGAAKPDAAFFSRVAEKLRSRPSQICLIDDSEKNVVAARRAGWSAIWYRSVTDLSAIPLVGTDNGRQLPWPDLEP